jgi:hypothetical protein
MVLTSTCCDAVRGFGRILSRVVPLFQWQREGREEYAVILSGPWAPVG